MCADAIADAAGTAMAPLVRPTRSAFCVAEAQAMQCAIPRWFLLALLSFLDQDVKSGWALVEAVWRKEDALADAAVEYHLIE